MAGSDEGQLQMKVVHLGHDVSRCISGFESLEQRGAKLAAWRVENPALPRKLTQRCTLQWRRSICPNDQHIVCSDWPGLERMRSGPTCQHHYDCGIEFAPLQTLE
jgi:hypothetical protein